MSGRIRADSPITDEEGPENLPPLQQRQQAPQPAPRETTNGEAEPPEEPAQAPQEGAAEGEEPGSEQHSLKRRLEREVREKYERAREAQFYRQQLEALQRQAQGAQPDDAEQRGYQRALQEQREQAFNAACNRIYEEGGKQYAEFSREVEDLAKVGGALEPQRFRAFLESVSSLPNGHQVYHELAQDLRQAEEVMRMTPAQMATRLARLSVQFENGHAEQAAPRTNNNLVSRAPPPVRTIGGTSAPRPQSLEKMPMRDFIKQRDAEEWERRRGG